jgi:hypothetical protein
MTATLLPWIDYLPEVGDAILTQRGHMTEACEEAQTLETHAHGLRQKVRRDQDQLVQRVEEHWDEAEVKAAQRRAIAASPTLAWRENLPDESMRDALKGLDGLHLASEALQAFQRGRVIRQHDLLSTAAPEDLRATAARALEWWNIAARPVVERLANQSSESAPYCGALPGGEPPRPEVLLASPSSSPWLLAALRSALDGDPLEVAVDAALLGKVLCARAARILE